MAYKDVIRACNLHEAYVNAADFSKQGDARLKQVSDICKNLTILELTVVTNFCNALLQKEIDNLEFALGSSNMDEKVRTLSNAPAPTSLN